MNIINKKISCIYKVTNDINNKIYIGKTNDLNRRKNEHKNHAKKDGGDFHADILKYGCDVFHYKIIELCDNKEELLEKEKYYIDVYKNNGYNLYNICKGGLGGQTHDVSGKNNPMYGKHKTEEEKAHLSDMLKGKAKPDGFGDKISKKLKGKPKSEKAVAKKSHPIKIIDITNNEIMSFKSKADCYRMIKVDGYLFTKYPNKIFKNRYKLYKEDEYINEGQTTIENITA